MPAAGPVRPSIAQARADRQALYLRLEALEAPDAVYVLIKRHLADFLDSLEYAIDDAGKNPLRAYLGFPYSLQHVARCDRSPDETRCGSLQKLVEQLEENRERVLALAKVGGEAPSRELPEDDLSISVKMEPEDYRTLLGKKLGDISGRAPGLAPGGDREDPPGSVPDRPEAGYTGELGR